jgi:hypothetical protein
MHFPEGLAFPGAFIMLYAVCLLFFLVHLFSYFAFGHKRSTRIGAQLRQVFEHLLATSSPVLLQIDTAN